MADETRPSDAASVVRLGKKGPELVEMRWGWQPHHAAEPVINVRAETADLTSRRCLVPATQFALFTGAGHPRRRWTITLRGEHLFFLAALWADATADWPESYAVITIDAAPDLAPLSDRQMAVIRPSDARAWLMTAEPHELLRPLAAGSYEVDDQGTD